jgi:alkylhydroperoxidase/carboxymuconolactone decarboxylase family protein YurZ
MTKPAPEVSDAFKAFQAVAPKQAEVWMGAARGLGAASALDPKTAALAYLAVLAAMRLASGVPFHVGLARQAGATREEILSALLVGLPAAGNVVIQALPPALEALETTGA